MSEYRDALERLYVNVRPEYPFGVRDWEIVKSGIDALEIVQQERDDLLASVRDHCSRPPGVCYQESSRHDG